MQYRRAGRSGVELPGVLRRSEVTSAIIGASRVDQLDDDLAVVEAPPLTDEELKKLDEILEDAG